MSYQLKYTMSFKSLQNDDCAVWFLKKDYEGNPYSIDPGLRPFVLREYNSENDFFKPLRPMQADIEILATPFVTMDEFISEEDDTWEVQFYFNESLYWYGYLLQDDIQETWIDVDHIITLRASDGLGSAQGQTMPELTGVLSVYSILFAALGGSSPVAAISPGNPRIICNLFYDGMTESNETPLTQVDVDIKTFEGDDRYTVINKILRAWNLSLFQYQGFVWMIRLEEYFNNVSMHGIIEKVLLSNTGFSGTFDAYIGVDEAIKPMMPEMIRMANRTAKRVRTSYYYNYPTEIFPNQTFLAGDNIIPTTDTFEIDDWTNYKLSGLTPVPGTNDLYRKEVLDGDGNITDNYMFIESDPTTLVWAQSEPLKVKANDKFKFSIDFRAQRNVSVGPRNIGIVVIQLSDGVDTYFLDNDGVWNTSIYQLSQPYSSAELLTEWSTYEVKANSIPVSGEIIIRLLNTFSSAAIVTDTDANFKNLVFDITDAYSSPGVVGDYDQYEGAGENIRYVDEEVYLDDANNFSHKGALQYDGDLTGDNWYRSFNDTERLTFKRHYAIAKMLFTRRRRQRIEFNGLGLTWDDSGIVKPIGLHNRFTFVDDAPDKVFMINNLMEMDFSAGTWRGTLVEICDAGDDTDPDNYNDHSYANIYEKNVRS